MHFRFKLFNSISLIVTALVAFNAQAGQTILVFGDSLSASYGVAQNLGWVQLMQQRLAQQEYDAHIVNTSISGETTSGGLARFKQTLLRHKPNIVLIELGANDGFRGLTVKSMRQNLNTMIEQAKAANAKVVLLGMRIPPNYGLPYSREFSNLYSELAKKHQSSLVPFLLTNVAGKAELNQDDGIHPTANAQPILLENVWPVLAPLLKK